MASILARIILSRTVHLATRSSIAPELEFSKTTNCGAAALVLSIPDQVRFLGARSYAQHFALDATVSDGSGIASANGARMRIGN